MQSLRCLQLLSVAAILSSSIWITKSTLLFFFWVCESIFSTICWLFFTIRSFLHFLITPLFFPFKLTSSKLTVYRNSVWPVVLTMEEAESAHSLVGFAISTNRPPSNRLQMPLQWTNNMTKKKSFSFSSPHPSHTKHREGPSSDLQFKRGR